MPIVLNNVATQPNGVALTNAALAATSVATTTENTVVQTLGGNTVGDGNAGLFYFQAASTRPVDNVNVLGTPTTGRWIAAITSSSNSGIGPITASQTGIAETFVLVSGFAPVTYTLPPSVNVLGDIVTIRTQTTGTVTIRTSGDLLFDSSKTSPVNSVASVTATLTGGFVFNFRATSGAYYRVDSPASVA
jgi:hypothetical protein